MTSKEILELIESVDPSDTDTLDEIDARVWCFVRSYEFKRMLNKAHKTMDAPFSFWKCRQISLAQKRGVSNPIKYTRSRDALKSIRPSGWLPFSGNRHHIDGRKPYFYGLVRDSIKAGVVPMNAQFTSSDLPTEELAELHAIIQAIEYERGKS